MASDDISKNTIQINNYVYYPNHVIGKGAFATVYMGSSRLLADRPVAVKQIRISELQNRMNKLWSEIKIMKQLSHPNIIRLYDIHLDLDDEALYMFLEYCNQGDLSDYVKKKILPKETILDYFNQIRNGLEYLHQNQVLHRDLKPQNILVHDTQIKICDFGLSTLADQNTLISTMCGSPLYMAPEIIQNQKYTIKSDLWSLGVILYELFYHKHPYESTNYSELTHKIKQPILFPVNSRVSDLARNLLARLLEKDCDLRIGWESFFNHRWFQENKGIIEVNSKSNKTGRIYLSSNGDQLTKCVSDVDSDEIFECSLESLTVHSDSESSESSESQFYSCDEDNAQEITENKNKTETDTTDTASTENDRSTELLGLSRHIVSDYTKSHGYPMRSAVYTSLASTAQSAPDRHGDWNQIGSMKHSAFMASPGSVGSKFYKYMYKSYSMVKNSFDSS